MSTREHRRRLRRRRQARTGLIVGTVAVLVALGVAVTSKGDESASTPERVTTTTQAGSTTTTDPVQGTEPIRAESLGGPKTAAETTTRLQKAEEGLRGENRDPAVLRQLSLEQQLAYRALANKPEWVPEVVAALPEAFRPAAQATVDAGAALGTLAGSVPAPTSFPNWEIKVPLPATELRGYYDEAEQASGVPWAYFAAIHFVETRMGRIHGLSTAGAQGPMQFIPATWADYGEGDINNNRDAILAAGRYLEARGGIDRIDRALFAYNNDNDYVAAIKAYAAVLLADPRAYDGYYGWNVLFQTGEGSFLLPPGYHA